LGRRRCVPDRIKVYISAPDRVIRTGHVNVDAEFTFSIVLEEGDPVVSTLRH
jgi:hypothetical protein